MDTLIPDDSILRKIHEIRGCKVMLDSDLAELYRVETKVLNQAVKRNIDRFPEEFCFMLREKELDNLRSQNVTSSFSHGGRRYQPFVFTEQGVAMLSAVLKSEVAVKVSIQIMQAFVSMRKTLSHAEGLIQRLEIVEFKQHKTDTKLEKVLQALEMDQMPKQGVFFEGQLFDAHVFVSKLIKQAHSSLELVDNYVDETTLLLLSKHNKQVACRLVSRPRAALLNDIEKHNRQYDTIKFIENHSSHDRFLILDDAQLYHFGASFKDLGRKCFAFSRMDSLWPEIKNRLLKAKV